MKILTLLLLFFALNSQGQDQIIFKNGDTLYTSIRKASLEYSLRKIQYKKDSSTITLTPRDVLSYHSNGINYNSVRRLGDTVPTFETHIEKGGLYQVSAFIYKNALAFEITYRSKKVTLTEENYQKQSLRLLRKYKELVNLIKSGRIPFSDLPMLFQQINKNPKFLFDNNIHYINGEDKIEIFTGTS